MHHCHHRCPHGRHPHNNYLQNWNVFSCFASLDFLTEAQPIQSLWLCPMDSRRSDKKKKSINRPTEYFQGRQHNTKQCWIFSYHLVCASLQKIYTNIKWGFWGDNYDYLLMIDDCKYDHDGQEEKDNLLGGVQLPIFLNAWRHVQTSLKLHWQ